MTDTMAGLKSTLDVNASPVIPGGSLLAKPHVWAWIWFVTAVLVIIGFHIRVFGHPVPPAANFP
jgi:hypothetical protein